MTRLELALSLSIIGAALSLAAATSPSPMSPSEEVKRTPQHTPDWGGEGVLLSSPGDGPDLSVTQYVEPDLISFVYESEDSARLALNQLSLRGERVCLVDLNPPSSTSSGPRWWVFSC